VNDKQPKQNLASEIAGWYGMGAIALAYMLVSFNVVQAGGAAYQLLNLSGSVGILIISVVKRLRQTLVLNIFWSTIALLALIKLALH
jgi:hypothetical protein